MEIYLLIALIFVYLMTVLMVDKAVVRRIWTLAFMAAFALTIVSLGYLRVYHQDVLLGASSWNWYYMMYLFGSLAAVLGIINLWMYRGALWHLLFDSETPAETVLPHDKS